MSRSNKRTRPRFASRGKQLTQLSVLMLSVGIYLRETPLISMSLFLMTLLFMCYILCGLNFRGLILRRETPEAVFAGDKFSVYLSIKRLRGLPLFCISIKDYFLPEKKSHFLIPVVTNDWSRIGRGRMKLPKRGVHEEAKCKLSSDFPFGLFSIEKTMTVPVSITVYPEPLSFYNDLNLLQGQENEVERESFQSGVNTGSFRGLREFTPGDPVKLISWQASARSANLMVRDLEPPEPERFVVVFHALKVKNVIPDVRQFEKCLKILSGLFMYLKSHNNGFEFYSSINNWQPIICDNPAEIPATALAVLASAKFGDPDSLNAVKDVLQDIPIHYHGIVIGASDISSWREKMPHTACSITYIDSKYNKKNGGDF